MAFVRNFDSGTEGSGGGKDNQLYNPQQFADPSVLEILREMGYILTPVDYDIEQVIKSFQAITINLKSGSVPGFQDGSGNFYIATKGNGVFLLEKSKVNPNTGTPDDGPSGSGTGGPSTGGPTPPGGGGTGGPSTGGPIFPPTGGGSGGPNPPTGGGGSTPPTPMNPIGSGRIYTRFEPGDLVIDNLEIVTRALWTNNQGMLAEFFTGSLTDTQKDHYYEVYNATGSGSNCSAQPQFSVAYGNIYGSGSADYGGQIEDTPTRAIYGQWRQLCLDPGETGFNITGTVSTGIYAVNINRARMLEYIDEGNIELNLAHLSGSEFVAGGGSANEYTGSNVGLKGTGEVVRLIDDSTINQPTINSAAGEVYNMVSGSIEDGVYNSSDPVVYGKLYKRIGVVILDADMLDASASFGTVTGREIDGDNSFKLFTSISGAAQYNDGSGDTLGFSGRGAELVKSSYFFCRIRNGEYNFSNNHTFVTGSNGNLRHPSMRNNPTTYITTVGLYNEYKELMAVAKLSQPLKKDFTRDTVIKVKMDY